MNIASQPVLLVEDDPDFTELACHLLGEAGYTVTTASTVALARAAIRGAFTGVVVLDLDLPDGSGLEVFADLRANHPGVPVLFMTASGLPDVALETLAGGAFAFLQKTDAIDRLVQEVDEATGALAAQPARLHPAFHAIITQSRSMRLALRSVEAALDSRVPVLIQGESGTGKELVARAFHEARPHPRGAFVAINCASVPDGLIESELFGHEQGAFTGATRRKLGRFELARGGTLFLDEVGEMDPRMQSKLLRVLQTGEYTRVGGTETLRADARVLAATHDDLERKVEDGRFRGDLFYRLAVYSVRLPPLRDRAGDIPLLTEAFIARTAADEGRDIAGIDPMALEVLGGHPFPGNVRQLENILTHAVLATRRRVVTLMDLPERFLRGAKAARGVSPAPASPAPASPAPASPGPASPAHAFPALALPALALPAHAFPTLAEMEERHIRAALVRAAGNKADAARLLGVSRMTLYRKLAALAAPSPSERSDAG